MGARNFANVVIDKGKHRIGSNIKPTKILALSKSTRIIVREYRTIARSRQHINKFIPVALRNESLDTRIGCSRNKYKLNVAKE